MGIFPRSSKATIAGRVYNPSRRLIRLGLFFNEPVIAEQRPMADSPKAVCVAVTLSRSPPVKFLAIAGASPRRTFLSEHFQRVSRIL